LRTLRHVGKCWTVELVFDLHAIAEGIEDKIVFDDTGDKGPAAVVVPEINPGSGAYDRIAPDYPIPGRCLGRDPVRLLIGADTDYQVSIQDDVMGDTVRRVLSLDPIASETEAVDGEVADDDVTGIDDLDGTVSDLASDHRAGAWR